MNRTSARVSAAAVICAITAAGCGGGSAPKTAVRRQCRATIGFIGPAQAPLAKQQLAFARLAVAKDNASRHTAISLVLAPPGANATLAADRFAAGAVVAVLGPASNGQVQAVGPVFARAGLAFISGSATGTTLTGGANPTFFRVVPSDALEGSQAAHFVLTRVRLRGAVVVIDDGAASSRQFVRGIAAGFKGARLPFTPITAVEGVTPVGALAAHITPLDALAVLAWHDPSEASQLGRLLLTQRKTVTLLGPSQLFDPRFTTPGSYVTYWAPDITALHADTSLVQAAKQSLGSFGLGAPPMYAATHVIDSAIAAVCRAGGPPSRSAVLAAVRSTNEPSSVLGIPIKFRLDGDLASGRWFVFHIQPGGRYQMVPRQ
ncbi:MAG TPA: ABC transporter substrate-binding protein [Solirubrobacteraceae bacterium]|nr:ABC transporter substrate-binding protein [Solirubrobacteraceae bacterium]